MIKTEQIPITVWGPSEAKRKDKPGFRHVFLGLFLGILAYPLIPVTLFAIFANGSNSESQLQDFYASSGGTVLSLIMLWAGMLTGVLFAVRAYRPLGFKKLIAWKFNKWDPLIGILFTGVFLLISFAITQIFNDFFTSFQDKELGNTGVATSAQGGWQVLIILGVCIGAPVVEEIFFRGLLLKVAIEKFKPFLAILISSLMFGLMHIQPTLEASIFTVISTTMVGIGLAVLRLISRRLGPAVWAHIIFNTVNLTLAYSTI